MKMIAIIVLIASLVSHQSNVAQEIHEKKHSAFARGLASGIAGGLLAQYPNAIKNLLYQGKPVLIHDKSKNKIQNVALNFRNLSRGISVFTSSITLGTLTQTPLKETVGSALPSVFSTSAKEFSSLAAAGLLSAVFVCPADYYLIKQQKTGLSFRQVIQKHSIKKAFSAVGITGSREIFSAAFLISDSVADYVNLCPHNKVLHSLGGSIPVAIVSASLSAPLDKIKTLSQSNDISTKQAFKRIYNANGLKKFVTLPELAGRNGVFLVAIPAMCLAQEMMKLL